MHLAAEVAVAVAVAAWCITHHDSYCVANEETFGMFNFYAFHCAAG
jgi:hypothetical protein